MKRIIGIFVMTLLIATTVLPIISAPPTVDETQIGNIIVIGIMDSIATTVENRDYEVTMIAIVIESGSIHILNSGEMIRLYNYQGIEIGSIVVAFCDDWGIIG